MSDRPQTPEGGETLEAEGDMDPARLHCMTCGKSVSTPLPENAMMRAVIDCPECYEAARSPAPEAVEALRAFEEIEKLLRGVHGRDADRAHHVAGMTAAKLRAALSAPRVEAERVGTLTVELVAKPVKDGGGWRLTTEPNPWDLAPDGGPRTYEIRLLPAPPETTDDE